MAVVCIRGQLKALAGGQGEHQLEGATVVDLLRALEAGQPALAGWILDERGRSAGTSTCSSTASRAKARRRRRRATA